MKKLICLAIILLTVTGLQLATLAAPAHKHQAEATGRSVLKTTGAQMDAPYVARGTHWENYNFGDNSPNRLSIVDESCPHEKLTEFGFGSVSSANNEWDFRIRWTPRSGEQVDAFKVTMVLYDEFHSKLDTVTFTVPEEIETIAARNDGHHHNIKTGYGMFSYNGIRAGGGPLGLGRPITTHIIDVKAYISAVSLSDGTVWQASPSTHHWAEILGAGDAAPKVSSDAPKDDQATSGDVAPPDLSAGFDLASFVDRHNGQLPFSVRETYSQKYAEDLSGSGNFWFQGDLGGGSNHGPIYGHKFLAINSLGKSNLSAEQAAVLLDQNIETLFPGNAKGEDIPQIQPGTQSPLPKFKLVTNVALFADQMREEQRIDPRLVTALETATNVQNLAALIKVMAAVNASQKTSKILLAQEVECADVTDYHFMFRTVPGHHILQGTATHGVFKDASGELWMFQQGRGPADEDLLDARFLRPENATFVEWIIIGLVPNIGSNLHGGSQHLQAHINYTIADIMWRIMASNFKDVIQSQSHF